MLFQFDQSDIYDQSLFIRSIMEYIDISSLDPLALCLLLVITFLVNCPTRKQRAGIRKLFREYFSPLNPGESVSVLSQFGFIRRSHDIIWKVLQLTRHFGQDSFE